MDSAAHRRRVETVFGAALELIRAQDSAATHRALIAMHVEASLRAFLAEPMRASVQVPLLVHLGLAGAEEPAVPVAAAALFIHLGADLFDNMFDHELDTAWQGRRPAEVTLAAATLLAALPGLSLAQIPDAGRAGRAQAILAQCVFDMSAGQCHDLALQGDAEPEPAAVRDFVERQSGRQVAAFAAAAAVVAGADEHAVQALYEYGLCLGAAAQIASDITDITAREVSPDLANGRRTLPIAYALRACSGAAREELAALLAAAAEDAGCHGAARAAITQAGGFSAALMAVRAYRHRGRQRLAQARLGAGVEAELAAFLDATMLTDDR